MCYRNNPAGQSTLQPGERHLAELGLSTRETTVLQISRCFFQSFAQPASHGWLRAHRLAAAELPEPDGARILGATLDMVQGLRMSRKSVFRFSNPVCAHCARVLTAHERLMVGSLSAFGAGRPDDAVRQATLLCEGNDMDDYLGASERLAKCLRRPEEVA